MKIGIFIELPAETVTLILRAALIALVVLLA